MHIQFPCHSVVVVVNKAQVCAETQSFFCEFLKSVTGEKKMTNMSWVNRGHIIIISNDLRNIFQAKACRHHGSIGQNMYTFANVLLI